MTNRVKRAVSIADRPRRSLVLILLLMPLTGGAQPPSTCVPTGSWLVQCDPEPGGPFERAFTGLWTFGEGGTLLVSAHPPTRRRTADGGRPLFELGHGGWVTDTDGLRWLFR